MEEKGHLASRSLPTEEKKVEELGYKVKYLKESELKKMTTLDPSGTPKFC